MSALISVLVCGGGCLVLCVVMMRRMHGAPNASEMPTNTPGPSTHDDNET